MKKVIWLIVASIVLASCGPITAIPPTPTLLSTSTQTMMLETPSSAQTPSFTPTPTATEPLPPVANEYRLQPWSADDEYYSKLAQEYSKDFYYGINDNQYRYDTVFQAENLLRNPSNNWRETAWQITADYPRGIPFPRMRPGEDLTAFLLEDLLNTQNVKPDELIGTVNDKLSIPWGCYGNHPLKSHQ